MTSNKTEKLLDAANKARKRVDDSCVEGTLDLVYTALDDGTASVKIISSISEMTPAQAKFIGYSLYKIGCVGIDLEAKRPQDVTDDDFFEE